MNMLEVRRRSGRVITTVLTFEDQVVLLNYGYGPKSERRIAVKVYLL